jgi:hypothetical protein
MSVGVVYIYETVTISNTFIYTHENTQLLTFLLIARRWSRYKLVPQPVISHVRPLIWLKIKIASAVFFQRLLTMKFSLQDYVSTFP